ncbi:TonB family protein [Sphingomonas parva]|uniref:TonB family protein n=1 Tax=Sphingomonas parva TaxID=2555898 RepID=A0A4Y8ZMX1_9SPHN|nr:TonB family protein [Sphingomonas parva]TFI57304.1 TonB family protein [Sphingomonas parva]
MRRILVMLASAACAVAAIVLVVNSGRPLATGLALALGAALALLARAAAAATPPQPADGAAVQPPALLDGRVVPEDWPAGPWFDRREGAVTLGFTVDPDGRPRDVRVTASSGVAELDERSREIVVERFRFAPARDRRGRAVDARVEHRIDWSVASLDGSVEIEAPPLIEVAPRPAC